MGLLRVQTPKYEHGLFARNSQSPCFWTAVQFKYCFFFFKEKKKTVFNSSSTGTTTRTSQQAHAWLLASIMMLRNRVLYIAKDVTRDWPHQKGNRRTTLRLRGHYGQQGMHSNQYDLGHIPSAKSLWLQMHVWPGWLVRPSTVANSICRQLSVRMLPILIAHVLGGPLSTSLKSVVESQSNLGQVDFPSCVNLKVFSRVPPNYLHPICSFQIITRCTGKKNINMGKK
jgi:hypothetical protein